MEEIKALTKQLTLPDERQSQAKEGGAAVEGQPDTEARIAELKVAQEQFKFDLAQRIGATYVLDAAHDLADLLLGGRFLDKDGLVVILGVRNMVICIEECDAHAHMLRRSQPVPLRPPAMMMEPCDMGGKGMPRMRDFRQLEVFQARQRDRLTFQRILEFLDGIVDTPGRVIVANTNDPDALDPALRRPGRLGDFDVHLGYLTTDQVAFCLREHFGSRAGEETLRRELADVVEAQGRKVTLAEMHAAMRSAQDARDALRILTESAFRVCETSASTSEASLRCAIPCADALRPAPTTGSDESDEDEDGETEDDA
jgi:hypothetical protein